MLFIVTCAEKLTYSLCNFFTQQSFKMSPSKIIGNLLLLVILATTSAGNCVRKKCPLGQFYNATSDSCAGSCYPHYGNWTTGNCTEGIACMCIL